MYLTSSTCRPDVAHGPHSGWLAPSGQKSEFSWLLFASSYTNPDFSGEIDILEGVNDQETNSFALHTSEGCSISQGGISGESFTGKISTPNCDVAAEGQGKNVGCAIKSNDPQSYGEGLNANKGGVFATEWTDEAISIYFFPRSAVPQDALSESPDPSNWGPPTARFAGGCDIPSFFKNNKIVFDTTFCGDWAGAQAVWGSGSCASKADTCEAYVKNNQSDFADAHWTVRGLKVYSETKGDTPPPSNVTVPTASPAIPSISEVFPGQSTFTTRVRSSVGSSGYVPVNSSAPTLKPQPPVATRQPQPPNPIRPSFSLETSLSPSAPVDSGSASPTLPVTTDTPANTAVPAPNPGGPLSGFKWPRPGF